MEGDDDRRGGIERCNLDMGGVGLPNKCGLAGYLLYIHCRIFICSKRADHQFDDKILQTLRKSLLAKGMFQLLPRWLCCGEFNSYVSDCERNLLICWFVDSIDLHLRDLIGNNIRHVDWKGLAQFNDFGGW